MNAVNIHQAKSTLSHLVMQVERQHAVITLCRNGHPVAQIVPMDRPKNPLVMHAQLQGVRVKYDPIEPFSKDEWSEDES